MRQALKLHPDSRCTATTHIDVQIARPRPGHLELHYFVTGNMRDLHLPQAVDAGRGDELWQHTCFEAFVRAPPRAAYYEFNFAPSMQWAVYEFRDYRTGMSVVSEISAPRIEAESDSGSYQLLAALELDRLPHLAREAEWHLGVAAVIEDSSGGKSHWALAHPRGEPDFHNSEGFVHKIGTAEHL